MSGRAGGPELGVLLAAATADLAAAGVASPESDARWLVRHATGWSGADLVLRRSEAVPRDLAGRVRELVARRAAREPLQLILGSVAFRHVMLDVEPGVFLPRPETEVLVDVALERLGSGGVVVEPCTGTGAVAIALATEAGPGRVVATDSSAAAVDLAAVNAARAGAGVEVCLGDLLDPVDPDLRGTVDLLVCNPPYLADAELEGLEAEVAWDPPAALSSGPSGHEVTDRLIAAAGEWLAPGGWLVVEVDPSRAAEVARRAAGAGLVDVTVHRDLTGRDRIVAARR